MLSLERILIDGALFTLLMSALILVSLVINPRIWINDYPPEIRQRAAPLSASEKQFRSLFTVLFLAGFVVVPYLSTRALAEAAGESASFLTLYLHAFALFNLFNLFDAFVIDWLFLGVLHPKFAFIPEAWGQRELFTDGGKLVRDWLKGIVFCVVGALVITGVVMVIG